MVLRNIYFKFNLISNITYYIISVKQTLTNRAFCKFLSYIVSIKEREVWKGKVITFSYKFVCIYILTNNNVRKCIHSFSLFVIQYYNIFYNERISIYYNIM